MRLNFIPIHVFREAVQVSSFDAGVKKTHGADIVIQHQKAGSTYDGKFEQYYIHHRQIDNNLVIEGSRTFTLINSIKST